MSLAIENVLRKKAALAQAQVSAANARKAAAQREQYALEALEDTVSLVLRSKTATLSEVAKQLDCSRDKVKGMAKRADERNHAKMRGTYEG